MQLREVARRARMSLSTIYKRYATREDLIAAALQWWMDANRYAPLAGDGTERGDESVPPTASCGSSGRSSNRGSNTPAC